MTGCGGKGGGGGAARIRETGRSITPAECEQFALRKKRNEIHGVQTTSSIYEYVDI